MGASDVPVDYHLRAADVRAADGPKMLASSGDMEEKRSYRRVVAVL